MSEKKASVLIAADTKLLHAGMAKAQKAVAPFAEQLVEVGAAIGSAIPADKGLFQFNDLFPGGLPVVEPLSHDEAAALYAAEIVAGGSLSKVRVDERADAEGRRVYVVTGNRAPAAAAEIVRVQVSAAQVAEARQHLAAQLASLVSVQEAFVKESFLSTLSKIWEPPAMKTPYSIDLVTHDLDGVPVYKSKLVPPGTVIVTTDPATKSQAVWAPPESEKLWEPDQSPEEPKYLWEPEANAKAYASKLWKNAKKADQELTSPPTDPYSFEHDQVDFKVKHDFAVGVAASDADAGEKITVSLEEFIETNVCPLHPPVDAE